MRNFFKFFVFGLIFFPYLQNANGAISRVIPNANIDTSKNARTAVVTRGGANRSAIKKDSKSNIVSRSAINNSHNISTELTTKNNKQSNTSLNNTAVVRRAGITLRPTTAEVGGRAIIAGTNVQTGSNIKSELKSVKTRTASKTTERTAETIAITKQKFEQENELNKTCQDQYNDCMDQFCAVVDTNQKRCSCSANLTKYAKVEEAVNDANAQLNEVAQRIRYVGLSADEISAIMTETEAEEELSKTKDNSETRSLLKDIEDLIKDPSVSNTTMSSSGGYSSLDLDLDFSSDNGDLFSVDFLSGNTNNSMANLRGSELYKAAKKRCSSIVTQCTEAGVSSDLITGNYDLAIDKDCISYENGLAKMNETLVSNVRSANRMLQKARLAVVENKNEYDAKGCVSALETCMKDDMVCGDNYFKCLDPTKKYIDETGNVVLGQNVTNITSFMENYNSASIDKTFLSTAYGVNINDTVCTGNNNDGSCIVKYLLNKIGTKQKVADEGLCRAVLDKCQIYTYDSNDNYQAYNDIVVNYIQRAMVGIKAAQQNIISEYASECLADVAECYNQQVSQVNAWSSNANVSSIYKVMNGACRNVALTCAYAVFAYDTDSCPTDNNNQCLQNVSEMFYQSLLCPDYSDFVTTSKSDASTPDKDYYVNDHCKCNENYLPYSGSCVACDRNISELWYGTCKTKCDPSETRNQSTGECEGISNNN